MGNISAMANLTGPAIVRLFGQNLRRIRQQKHISQLTLATKADLTHNFINEIEGGHKWVSSATIARLADVLETDPFQFFVSAPPESVDADILDDYLEGMTDSFSKMVNDFRESLLHHREPPQNDQK
jgi:transcriptional regulator with XRE-family HTH domain